MNFTLASSTVSWPSPPTEEQYRIRLLEEQNEALHREVEDLKAERDSLRQLLEASADPADPIFCQVEDAL